MNENYLVLPTSVSNSLKKHFLFRGTLLAVCGALLLLASGIFLPVHLMKYWGVFILLLSGALITWGLLPYRKLAQLEVRPNKIVIEDGMVLYIINKKRVFGIPRENIEKIEFSQKDPLYGIGMWLKSPLPSKIIVYDKKFNLSDFQKKSQKQWNCDLFFPYFTKRSYESWIGFL